LAKIRIKIRKNDTIKVIAGKERGKTGKIIRIFPARNKALVEKLNLVKRHTKPTAKAPQGGVIEKEAPIDLSNLILFCERCNKPTRPKRKQLEDGKKVRICRKCGEMIGE